MANTTFDGPVRSRNGFQSIGPGAVPALTLATELTVADHAGRLLTMDPAATPTAITLPAIVTGADASTAGPGSDPNNPSTHGKAFINLQSIPNGHYTVLYMRIGQPLSLKSRFKVLGRAKNIFINFNRR